MFHGLHTHIFKYNNNPTRLFFSNNYVRNPLGPDVGIACVRPSYLATPRYWRAPKIIRPNTVCRKRWRCCCTVKDVTHWLLIFWIFFPANGLFKRDADTDFLNRFILFSRQKRVSRHGYYNISSFWSFISYFIEKNYLPRRFSELMREN